MKKGYDENGRKMKVSDFLIGLLGSFTLGATGILVFSGAPQGAATTPIILMLVLMALGGMIFSLVVQRYFIALGIAAVLIGLPILAFGLLIGACFFHPSGI